MSRVIPCPKCGNESSSTDICPKCGVIYTRYFKYLHNRPLDEKYPYTELAAERIPYDNIYINLFAWPLAFVLALAANLKIPFITEFLWLIFSVRVHELGHAICAWLASYLAFPLGFFIPVSVVSITFGNSSTFLFIVFISLLGWALYRGIRKNNIVVILTSSILIPALILCTFALTVAQQRFFVSFGGEGAELTLSTYFMLIFYYPVTRRLRWDFFRFLLLFAGAFVYVHSFVELLRKTTIVASGNKLEVSDTDKMLIAGWNGYEILSTYRFIGWACYFIIVSHYLLFNYTTFSPVFLSLKRSLIGYVKNGIKFQGAVARENEERN